MEDHGNCITRSLNIVSFKVMGKGGFGSIFIGTICKCTNPLFNKEPSFQHLGLYHGVLLGTPRSNKQNVLIVVLEKEMIMPITMAK